MTEISDDNPPKALPPAASDCSSYVPVARQYQPELTALEELVDVLYELLVDAPVTESVTVTALPQPTCFSGAPE
jgi:hypothetical protein